MSAVNNSVGSSLLLTTLLANCHVTPVTQTLLHMQQHHAGSRGHDTSSHGPAQSSWTGDGGGGGGGGAVVSPADVGRSSKDAGRSFEDGRLSSEESGKFYQNSARNRGDRRKTGSERSSVDVGDPSTTTPHDNKTLEESDPGAVMYIIVVLVFYSTGVMVMIVRYLRTEKKELEEEVTLENFFKSMPDKRMEKEQRVNLMAIRAFHTLTSISYDDDDLDGLDLDSDTETESRDRKSLDATSSQPLLVTDL